MPYAISQALVAYCLLRNGLEQKSVRRIGLALFLSFAIVLVKAHVALFFLPVSIAYAVMCYPGLRGRTRAGILALLSLMGAIALSGLFALKPDMGALGDSGLPEYMEYLRKVARPHDPLYVYLRGISSEPVQILLGLI